MDIRGGSLFFELFPALESLAAYGIAYKTFGITGQLHKDLKNHVECILSPEGRISDGITEESLVQAVKEKAHYIIDTSNLTQGN